MRTRNPRSCVKQLAREMGRPDAMARASDGLAARQFCVNAMLRSPPAARSKDPELEP